ncbi:MAG: alpha/beta fold hydrolase [Polyangiaceae bacterium]
MHSVRTVFSSAEDLRIHAVLLGPTWLSLEDELHEDFQQAGSLSGWATVTAFRIAGVNVDAVRPVDLVRSIPPRPLLMLSGSEDTDTPPAVMLKLQAATPGAERWVVPGAGHCSYFAASPVEYRRRLVESFDGALGGR